ncbi:hypothetical protein BW247_04870 [Acidihalobacter ferrooxydans]|uniref:Ice-binding protein C-terminal domain-containing protein n=1 Tax=Acidihalobacter ferrooxydans TaxID=1765967 RepID=A0A1P8UF75_9GAMM|nr:hypothetical protein BW247_04870 [Acidihalobacter ferrooxydans]
MIGVTNNSGSTLNSFNISGSNIFGFDRDGIDGYVVPNPKVAGNPDTTGYGGPIAYFTNITGYSSGTVNFYGGLANGANTYFSLEEGININKLPKISHNVPEPSDLGMLGLGLGMIGFLAWRRRRQQG